MEVYFAMLGDLPIDVLMIAAQKALLTPRWNNAFPSIDMLRSLALESMIGHDSRLTAGEAWQIATKAAWGCDIEVEGSVAKAFKDVPPIVSMAIKRFGFMALYNMPNKSIETARAQFRGIFESLLAQEKEEAMWTHEIRDGLIQLAERQGLATARPNKPLDDEQGAPVPLGKVIGTMRAGRHGVTGAPAMFETKKA